ncbi:MAG: adenylate kinase family protein [Halobacteriota archaeon]
MRVAITGTPGTGKTTLAREVADELGFEVVDMAALAREHASGYDERRDVVEADLHAIRESTEDLDDVVFDGHLSHYLDVDHVVVLRCHPAVLNERLRRRGWPEDKVEENVEAEALDVVFAEAVENHGEVHEIDTTDVDVREAAAEAVDAARDRKTNASLDRHAVDWSDHLFELDPEVESR